MKKTKKAPVKKIQKEDLKKIKGGIVVGTGRQKSGLRRPPNT